MTLKVEIESEQEVYIYFSLDDVKQMANLKNGESLKTSKGYQVSMNNNEIEVETVQLIIVDVDGSDFEPQYNEGYC
jgi:hypothetical protein